MSSGKLFGSHWEGYAGAKPYYKIAGIEHRSKETQELFRKKSSGTIILLRREPNNPHDANAIAVYAALTPLNRSVYYDDYNGTRGGPYEWMKVGYVERAVANDEFYGLPLDTVLETEKYGLDTFKLTGKTRKYKV